MYPDGSGGVRSLSASWTSMGALDPYVVVSAGRSSFRYADLLDLVAMVRRLEGVVQESCSAGDEGEV